MIRERLDAGAVRCVCWVIWARERVALAVDYLDGRGIALGHAQVVSRVPCWSEILPVDHETTKTKRVSSRACIGTTSAKLRLGTKRNISTHVDKMHTSPAVAEEEHDEWMDGIGCYESMDLEGSFKSPRKTSHMHVAFSIITRTA